MMPRKAIKRKAKTVKGWGKAAPKTMQQRRALKARCGAKAFLDPKNLKYPVMAKSGPCVVNCQGARAAKARLGQMVSTAENAGKPKDAARYRRMQKKADKLGKTAACHWAK
jgi:hypothetical protein